MTTAGVVRWRKLGRIFDPSSAGLPDRFVGYAQAPQALVFDEFVRIYFSTRSVDADSGKYRSHVLFADFTPALDRIVAISPEPVIPMGGLGCFDEHGIFPMSVIRVGDLVYAYTCGWSRRVSVSVETAVGLAVSRDGGRTFDRQGPGPILSATIREPFLVGDASVRVIGGTWHMWYIFGTAWRRYPGIAMPERTYKIGHATSGDGMDWAREEGVPIIPDRLGPDESQALPSVVEIDGAFHLFFCYRESADFRTNAKRGYRLGHAVSSDLASWVRADDELTFVGGDGEWDSDMQCYPYVYERDGRIYLLYNGNEFGRYGFGAAVLER
jgi:hypothetical protein